MKRVKKSHEGKSTGRVLLYTRTGEDISILQKTLAEMAAEGVVCTGIQDLCQRIGHEDASAVLLTEPTLADGALPILAETLHSQPHWSDLPVLFVAGGGLESPLAVQVMRELPNVLVLDRPVRLATLAGVLRMALRMRDKQWQVRALLDERRQAQEALEKANESLHAQANDLMVVNEELRESEEKYRRIVETATEGIAMADAEARMVFVNDRWSEIFGYSAEEASQVTLLDLVFPEDRDRMAERWESRKRGQKERYEFRFRRKDGRPVWLLVGVAPRLDPEGRSLGTLVMVTDISERKQMEETLRELNATLESKVAERTDELKHRAKQLQKLTLDMSETEERERKRMAAILHDDLQQQIAGAKFHVGLMRNRAKYDSSVQAIGAQVDHMLKDAIDKSRSLSHELSPAVLHHADFAETLRWLANEVQARHGLFVHVRAPDVVRLQSEALQGFLYRAAQELLFNVVKHAGVHAAEIRVRQCCGHVCLAVSDRGRGFDPRGLQEAAGFGLLSIRERIELLGGRMKIKSARGKGSTFLIVVPNGEMLEDRRPKTENGNKSRERMPSSVLRPPSSVLRVLLADDHEIVREGLRALLSDEHDVEIVGEAANGREAVDLASQLKPDVIVMDMSMPLIEGDEATRQIKACLPQTRVIAISMYDQAEKIDAMYRAGAERYVLKTAPSEELLAAIRGQAQAAVE